MSKDIVVSRVAVEKFGLVNMHKPNVTESEDPVPSGAANTPR